MTTSKGRGNSLVVFLGSPSFLIAVAMLLMAALLRGPVAARLNIKQAKAPLPMRSPLDTLDQRSLLPYRVVHRQILDSTVVEALGTDQYISWSLEDAAAAPNDPLRRANLLVTYDTGGHNLVPHTPDVCYLGAGYAPAQRHEDRRLELDSMIGEGGSIPVRVCTFVKTAVFGGDQATVVYTFHCNGRFVSTRTDVRIRLNDLTNTYAYFSKIEVGFPGATREQSLQGAKKLFDRLLPVLSANHFPDFDGAERAVREPIGSGRR